jgi:hypothetical protein
MRGVLKFSIEEWLFHDRGSISPFDHQNKQALPRTHSMFGLRCLRELTRRARL